jgi:hypothetical protein
MKVNESELREISQAFVAVGKNLNVVKCMLDMGQEYPAKTHLDFAMNSYKETKRRLQELTPCVDWGIEHEERKH